MRTTVNMLAQALTRLDAGWAYVVAGAVLAGACILVPARADLDEMRGQLDLMRAQDGLLEQRLQAHANLIDELDLGNPALIERLAATQLNLVRAAEHPRILAAETSASIGDWLDRTISPDLVAAADPDAARTRSQPRRSYLTRLTEGTSRLWLIGGSAICVFIGLLLGPARPRSTGVASWSSIDDDARTAGPGATPEIAPGSAPGSTPGSTPGSAPGSARGSGRGLRPACGRGPVSGRTPAAVADHAPARRPRAMPAPTSIAAPADLAEVAPEPSGEPPAAEIVVARSVPRPLDEPRPLALQLSVFPPGAGAAGCGEDLSTVAGDADEEADALDEDAGETRTATATAPAPQRGVQPMIEQPAHESTSRTGGTVDGPTADSDTVVTSIGVGAATASDEVDADEYEYVYVDEDGNEVGPDEDDDEEYEYVYVDEDGNEVDPDDEDDDATAVGLEEDDDDEYEFEDEDDEDEDDFDDDEAGDPDEDEADEDEDEDEEDEDDFDDDEEEEDEDDLGFDDDEFDDEDLDEEDEDEDDYELVDDEDD